MRPISVHAGGSRPWVSISFTTAPNLPGTLLTTARGGTAATYPFSISKANRFVLGGFGTQMSRCVTRGRGGGEGDEQQEGTATDDTPGCDLMI